MEEAVEEGTVFEKERPEILIDSEDTMPVGDINKLKGHRDSAFHGILVTASGTETAVAATRDKLELSAFGTAIHGTAIGRITTVDHLIHVFNDRIAWMEDI